MIQLKKIVVATDLSELSMCAVRHGCEIARQFGAELHLLTVSVYPFVDYIAQYEGIPCMSIDECEQELNDKCMERLNAVDVAPISDDSVVRIVKQGFIAEEVRKYCQHISADMLVAGTHGHTGLKHVLLGSIAEELVRTAPCPVLTVRDKAHNFVEAEPESESAAKA